MLGTPFTHDMIRKFVVSFGTLFNNIKLQRIDPDGGATQWISVPLSYAAKEKWHARLTDPRIAQQIAVSLPRISYELVTATYASDRKMNTMNRHVAISTSDEDKIKSMFAPVPYDFQFSLYVYSRNAGDASNIIEQILPFFTPEFTVTINDATDLNIDVDCPISLNSVNREDTYEGDFESRRVVTWTLDFTMKGLLFGPVRESGVIKKAYIDFFVPPTDSQTSYHSGNLTSSSTVSKIYLQANTASRTSNTYDRGTITITAEGPGETTGITGNTRTIVSYSGPQQSATVLPAFLDDPKDTWSYRIQYRTQERSDFISPDQLIAIPTTSRIYTQPGLTADGDPTNNPEISVAVDEIDASDDYGIIKTQTFFPSNTVLAGTRRNLKTGEDEFL